MLGPGSADGADDLERETDAVFEAAAVLVGTVVGERGEELVEQIAVGGVDLDEVEAGGGGAMGGGDEVGDDLVEAGAVEGGGKAVGFVEGDGGGCEGLPAAFGGRDEAGLFPGGGHAGLAAGVGELGAGEGAVVVEKVGDALEAGDVVVGVDAEVVRGDAAFGADGAGLGEDEGGAADGAAAEMDEVPVVGEAVDGGVLAHGGDGDAVGKREAAQFERREEMVRRLSHGHWMLGGWSGIGILGCWVRVPRQGLGWRSLIRAKRSSPRVRVLAMASSRGMSEIWVPLRTTRRPKRPAWTRSMAATP